MKQMKDLKQFMVKEAYCSFEVAKLLKERGFVESCYGRYSVRSKEFNLDTTRPCNNGGNFLYCAPTHQMAMRWLREVHDIETCVEYSIPDDAYNYTIIVKDVTNGFTIIHSEGIYEVYEKATDELLKYCLENLI